MTNPLMAFGKFIARLLGFLDKIAPMVKRVAQEALPVVEMIATHTPTRSDDEIVALFRRYGLGGVDAYLALPIDDRGPALLKVATHALQQKFPTLPIGQIQTGILGALTHYRATK